MKLNKATPLLITLVCAALWLSVFHIPESQASLFKRTQYFSEQNLPEQNPVPGGIALIPFDYKKTGKKNEKPDVRFYGNRVMVLNTAKNRWLAVVGLSLKIEPGSHNIEIKQTEQPSREIPFKVKDKQYEAQYITLKDKEYVSPPEETLKRIREESRIMKAVFKSWNDQNLEKLSMDYPVEGPMSSPFGLKRFFNNQARNPHSGLDIAAPTGSPIQNPLAGTVAAVGHYYFNGNTVLVDHGQGLVSMYCHLDSIAVEEGQELKIGEVLGTVGSTGRVTGPHLHWSVNLNNTRVDPMLFMQEQPEAKKNK